MISIVMWIKPHWQLWLLVHSSPLADAINARRDWAFSDGEDSLMREKSCEVAALLSHCECLAFICSSVQFSLTFEATDPSQMSR
jgi:hypothetical protein